MLEPAHNRRGSGLMMVIVLGMAAMILIIAAISFAYGSITFAATRTNYINALMLAETALNKTIKTAHISPTSFNNVQKVPANPGYTGQALVDWLWESAPGIALGTDKKMCLQEGDFAIGVAKDGNYIRSVRVKYTTATPPTLPAAMYIHANNVNPIMKGGALNIDGKDYLALSKTPNGPGAAVHGLGTSTQAGYQAWIDLFKTNPMKNKKDNIRGKGPIPDVVNVGSLPTLTDLINLYTQYATLTIAGDYNISGPNDGSWGTPASPEIVLIKNNTKISGNVSGCGVLVVEGDCVLTGNFTWQGIVVVKGNLQVGQGSAEIWGAMLIENPNATVEVDLRGSFDCRYSTQALNYLRNFMIIRRDTWEEL